jgi:hypothetical protein
VTLFPYTTLFRSSYAVGAYSGIAGSGTINTIPKFTASSVIGDSAITDDGTTVTLVSRALSGTSASFSGNLTVDTNTLFVDSVNNRVGIGTSSPASNTKLSVVQAVGGVGIQITDNTYDTGFLEIINQAFKIRANNNISFDANGTERMRITSGGNVGIGTDTPSALLTVSSIGFDDTYFRVEQRRSNYASAINLVGTNDAGAIFNRIASQTNGGTTHWQIGGGGVANTMAFLTGGTERMRITSGGFTKASNNGSYLDTNTYHEIRQSNNNRTVLISNSSASFTNTVMVLGSATSASASYNFIAADDGAVGQFRVSGNGVIYAQNTSVQSITSDRELKTDIKDYNKGLAEVLAMKPRYFKYKDNLDEEKCGFIAQEMEDAIEGSMVDSSMEGYKTYQVDWYPLLVKAIQELKAEIDEQQQTINSLINR